MKSGNLSHPTSNSGFYLSYPFLLHGKCANISRLYYPIDYEESIIAKCIVVYYLKILICWLIISYLKIGVESFNARSASETVSFSKVPVNCCNFN